MQKGLHNAVLRTSGTHQGSQLDDQGSKSQERQLHWCLAVFGQCIWINTWPPHPWSIRPQPHPSAHQGNNQQLLWWTPAMIQDSQFHNPEAKPGNGDCNCLYNLPNPLYYGNEILVWGRKTLSKYGVRHLTIPTKRLHRQPYCENHNPLGGKVGITCWGMTFTCKPKKSRSVVIRNGKLTNRFKLHVQFHPQKRIQLSAWEGGLMIHLQDNTDRNSRARTEREMDEWLRRTEKSGLQRKFKAYL